MSDSVEEGETMINANARSKQKREEERERRKRRKRTDDKKEEEREASFLQSTLHTLFFRHAAGPDPSANVQCQMKIFN